MFTLLVMLLSMITCSSSLASTALLIVVLFLLVCNPTCCFRLGWGIWKNKRGYFNDVKKEGVSDDAHIGRCNVMFIDFGESQMTCSIVKFR